MCVRAFFPIHMQCKNRIRTHTRRRTVSRFVLQSAFVSVAQLWHCAWCFATSSMALHLVQVSFGTGSIAPRCIERSDSLWLCGSCAALKSIISSVHGTKWTVNETCDSYPSNRIAMCNRPCESEREREHSRNHYSMEKHKNGRKTFAMPDTLSRRRFSSFKCSKFCRI